MQAAAILVLLICYGTAGYLTWQQRNPIYLFALIAGHLGALLSPLWSLLYSGNGKPSLGAIQAAISQPPSLTIILIAGWHYSLPTLLVLFLYVTRWWFPGNITGGLTYLVFTLYHLLIELIGLRANLWSYQNLVLPLGLPAAIVAAIMAGLVSYTLLYVLLATYRYAWTSMAFSVIPALLLISLLVHGLLGAPLWITLTLNGAEWAVALGTASALSLLLWAIVIVTGGLRRVE
ncbi:MAG: hypothetical protein HGA65_06550 [Oscillochloris sp.]|nr:hypothetical protein [Oscillochloris sp.]